MAYPWFCNSHEGQRKKVALFHAVSLFNDTGWQTVLIHTHCHSRYVNTSCSMSVSSTAEQQLD